MQVRKYTKTRTIFPTDESLNKCVYLATMEMVLCQYFGHKKSNFFMLHF